MLGKRIRSALALRRRQHFREVIEDLAAIGHEARHERLAAAELVERIRDAG